MPEDLRILPAMLERGLRSPVSTSAGRLFDGVAALVGLRQRVNFEGQAAMELEFAAEKGEEEPPATPEDIQLLREIRDSLAK